MLVSKLTEKEAIELLRNGDAAGFEFLFNAHKRRVYNLCLRLAGNQAVAEELMQEAFLLVFRRINTFRGDSAFTTWLHRVTMNVAFMYIRQQRSRLTPQVSLEETGPEDSLYERVGADDTVLAQSIDRITLENAIRELPPGYRIVLVLHDIEGYEHQEIADLLNCSIGNTKSQLHKARLKLRMLLKSGRRRSAEEKKPPVSVRRLPFAKSSRMLAEEAA